MLARTDLWRCREQPGISRSETLRSADCAPGPTVRTLAPDPASPAARRLRAPSRAASDRPARWPLGASPTPPSLPARRTALEEPPAARRAVQGDVVQLAPVGEREVEPGD